MFHFISFFFLRFSFNPTFIKSKEMFWFVFVSFLTAALFWCITSLSSFQLLVECYLYLSSSVFFKPVLQTQGFCPGLCQMRLPTLRNKLVRLWLYCCFLTFLKNFYLILKLWVSFKIILGLQHTVHLPALKRSS